MRGSHSAELTLDYSRAEANNAGGQGGTAANTAAVTCKRPGRPVLLAMTAHPTKATRSGADPEVPTAGCQRTPGSPLGGQWAAGSADTVFRVRTCVFRWLVSSTGSLPCRQGFGEAVRIAPGGHGRNAKLQLTVTLAAHGPVSGLYLHPDHRRRPRRHDSFGGRSV